MVDPSALVSVVIGPSEPLIVVRLVTIPVDVWVAESRSLWLNQIVLHEARKRKTEVRRIRSPKSERQRKDPVKFKAPGALPR